MGGAEAPIQSGGDSPTGNVTSPAAISGDCDIEQGSQTTQRGVDVGAGNSKPDIEHVPVRDDPRKWSPFRKNLSLMLIASASMITGLAANIQNPAVREMEQDLSATSDQFSLTISLAILAHGFSPLFWSAFSEVKGRKMIYVVSLTLAALGSVATAVSVNIAMVIVFRCVQNLGLSAVMTIGAATLADIYDPAERGTKMGIYYIAPPLGVAIGPLLGGGLTQGFNWRAIFWFLTINCGVIVLLFLFVFRDTFRKERSLTYQNIVKARMKAKATGEERTGSVGSLDDDKGKVDERKGGGEGRGSGENRISIRDVNPLKIQVLILKRWNNFVVLFASSLQFGFSLMVTYTTARTLSNPPYHYDAFEIGLVLLAYGFGCMAGSIIGGRWSDRELAKRKQENGGKGYAELRLKSTILGDVMLPLTVFGFGWVCRRGVHVSAIYVLLFSCGFFNMWIYSSTLAYVVDANVGRSGSAISTNSAFRGISGFVAVQVAVPLQDGLGDGWMYTIWTVILTISSVLILLVAFKGKEWRERAEAKEEGRK
ncbi:hypothetical protein AX16_004122 [Volvariella volvacea WC 439]|nr:hypothetical protein AX16_004122 [Volvariella volvacea WC 439]